MGTDFNGRDVPDFNPQDLLGDTTPSTKKTTDALASLIAAIGDGNKQSAKLNAALNDAVTTISGLKSKLDAIEATVSQHMQAGGNLLKKMQGGDAKAPTIPSLKDLLTGKGLDAAVDKVSKSSPEMKKLTATVTSRHTVYVKDESLLQAIKELHLTILRSNIGGSSRGRGSRRSGVGGGISPSPATPLTMAHMADVPVMPQGALDPRSGLGLGGGDDFSSHWADVAQGVAATRGHTDALNVSQSRYLDYLRNSKRFLHEQVYDALQLSGIRSKDVDTLRKSAALQSRYSKHQRKKIKRLEEDVIFAPDESARDIAVKKYVAELERANDKVRENNTLWGKVKNSIKETVSEVFDLERVLNKTKLIMAATVMDIKSAVMEASNWKDAYGSFLVETFKFHRSLGETQYTLGQSLELIKEFADTQKIAERTGQKRLDFELAAVKAMRKGIKSAKDVNKITMSSLKLATDIGVKSSETSDLLGRWAVQFNMSGNTVEVLSRHMREVAFQTGVAGEELLNAAKSAEKLLKSMRNLGFLTERSAANVIEMTTSAEKFGVGDQMQRVIQATQSHKDFFANRGLTTFLGQAGERAGVSPQELYSGQFSGDKKMQLKIAEGSESMLREFVQQSGGDGAAANLEKAIKNMSSEQQAVLNTLVQRQSDGEFEGSGAVLQFNKALRESGMSFGERIQKNQDVINSSGTTDKERQLAEQKNESMKFTEAFSHLNPLVEMVDSGANQAELLAEISKQDKRDNIVESLKAMGVANADGMSSQQLLDALGKQAGVEGSLSDPNNLRKNVTNALEKREEKEQEQRAKEDIFLRIEKELKEVNQSLKSWIGNPINNLVQYLGGYAVDFSDWLQKLFPSITGAMGKVWDTVTGLFSGVISVFKGVFSAMFGGLISAVDVIFGGAIALLSGTFNNTMAIFSGAVGLLVSGISGAFNFVTSSIGNIFNLAVSGISGAFNFIIGGISGAVSFVTGGISDTFNFVTSGISGVFGSIKDLFIGSITSTFNFITGGLGGVFGSIKDFFVGGITNAFNFFVRGVTSSFNFVIQGISKVFTNSINFFTNSIKSLFSSLTGGMFSWFKSKPKTNVAMNGNTNQTNIVTNRQQSTGQTQRSISSTMVKSGLETSTGLGVLKGLFGFGSPKVADSSTKLEPSKGAAAREKFSQALAAVGGNSDDTDLVKSIKDMTTRQMAEFNAIIQATSNGSVQGAGDAIRILETTAMVSPKPPGTIDTADKVHDKLREDRAGSSNTNHSMAKDIAGVENNTNEMLAAMKLIAANMEKFVAIMNSSAPSVNDAESMVASGDPRSKRTPQKASNFYTWNSGGYTGNATKGPVTTHQPV